MIGDKQYGSNDRPGKTALPSLRAVVIGVDALLLTFYILLVSPRLTGLPLHEIIGLSLFVPVLVHLLFSWSWIRQTTKRLLLNASPRTRFNYFVNATLFVLFMIEIISGLVISRVAVPFLGIKIVEDRSWRALHNQTLNWTLLLTGFHISVNWRWIANLFKKRKQTQKNKKASAARSRPIALLARISLIVFAAGVIALVIFLILGKPSDARSYVHDEIARFRPTIRNGIGQIVGETLLLSGVVYIAHRLLKIRL